MNYAKTASDKETETVFKSNAFEMMQKKGRLDFNNESINFHVTDYVCLTSFNHFNALLIQNCTVF